MRARILHALRDPARDGRGVRLVPGAGVLLIRIGPGRFSAVLFDAGNTLVHIDPSRLRDIFHSVGSTASLEDVRRAELGARRVLHAAIGDGHVGTEPEVWREYFAALFRLAGVPPEGVEEAGRLLERRHREAHLWTWIEEGTEDALTRLAHAGYRLGVISNADGRIASLLRETGLARHFEFVVDSEVVGIEKPDRRIFDHAVTRLGIAAEACLYVGDLFTVDYLGATGAGLGCVLVDPLDLYADRAPTVPSLRELTARLGAARAP